MMPEHSKLNNESDQDSLVRHSVGVLLIHGFSGSPHEFGSILPVLREKGYLVKTVTLPAHGDEPDIPIGATTAEAMLFHCLQEADEMAEQVERFYLVGHSLGGAYSLLTAAGKPEKLHGVVAYSAPFEHAYFYNYWQGLARLPLKFRTMVGCLRFASADRFQCVRPKFTPWTVPSLMKQSRLIFKWMRERTHQISVPIHLAHSQYDLVVPYNEMKKIAEAVSGPVETTTFWKSGHRLFPGSRDKDEALSILLNFLEKHEAAAYSPSAR